MTTFHLLTHSHRLISSQFYTRPHLLPTRNPRSVQRKFPVKKSLLPQLSPYDSDQALASSSPAHSSYSLHILSLREPLAGNRFRERFHMDGMQARNSQRGQATTLVFENLHKQPFVIDKKCLQRQQLGELPSFVACILEKIQMFKKLDEAADVSLDQLMILIQHLRDRCTQLDWICFIRQ